MAAPDVTLGSDAAPESGSITPPTGAAVGDLAVVFICLNGNRTDAFAGSGSVGGPTGWTLGRDYFPTPNWRPRIAWFWKHLVAGDFSSHTFTGTYINSMRCLIIPTGGDPVAASEAEGWGQTSPPTIPAGTSTVDESLYLTMCGDSGDGHTLTAPTGHTNEGETSGNNGGFSPFALSSIEVASAGAIAATAWSINPDDMNWSVLGIVIPPNVGTLITTFTAVPVVAGRTLGIVSSTLPGITSITQAGKICCDTAVPSPAGTEYVIVYSSSNDSDSGDVQTGTITGESAV